jgi:integrase
MTKAPRARRARGDGGYRNRGGDSWELKFPATDSATGQRRVRYVTFKGTETAARARLRELVKAAEDGAFVAPAKKTVATFLEEWDKTLNNVSPKTAQRYRELVRLHIKPHLGDLKLQALTSIRIEGFYGDLAAGHKAGGSGKSRPLAARTIIHVHRLLGSVLALAVRDRAIQSNPAREARPPRAERAELEILTEAQAGELLTGLRGRPLYLLAALGLATGMRRGEMLALRWRDIDLDSNLAALQVERSLEQTKAGLRFKAPKTKRGRRAITLPAFIVKELRAQKAAQAAQRLALGLGKESAEALVFRQPEGSPLRPDDVSSSWRKVIVGLKLPKVSLHALRHTHASQLIASGMDVLTISRRLGHGETSVTLDVYGHLFTPTDGGAASVIDRAFGGLNAE